MSTDHAATIGWRAIERPAIVVLLSVHFTLLAWLAYLHSPGWDETPTLVAGLRVLETGRFDVYCVNPPLVKTISALPVHVAGIPGDAAEKYLSRRPEFNMASEFSKLNGAQTFWYVTMARWACIPIGILGGIASYIWAKALYGSAAALGTLAVWSISPSLLGYGFLITPDAAAASCGLAAGYAFWKWLQRPSLGSSSVAGLVMGMAVLCKMTWLVLFVLWPMLAIVARSETTACNTALYRFHRVALLFFVAVTAIYLINLAYLFEGSFARLSDYQFASEALSGIPTSENSPAGNRFRDTPLAGLQVPFPANFIRGIDLQKKDFDGRMWSFLRGEWRRGGWWYYYLYAVLIKEPLGNWGLVGLALYVSLFRKEYNAPWRDELVLLAPAITILIFVSSQTGFNHHMRYVLPALPFIYIWCSKVFKSYEFKHWGIATIATGALIWSVVSSLSVFPHSLSYFNELVGGPKNGHWHLGNSNTDWGQDLLYLKKWYDKHPESRPLHVAYDNIIHPRVVDIECVDPPLDPRSENADGNELGPLPGWYIIGVNKLHSRTHDYDYFLEFEPVEWIGYTMPVYHITKEEANQVRKKLGLPELEK